MWCWSLATCSKFRKQKTKQKTTVNWYVVLFNFCPCGADEKLMRGEIENWENRRGGGCCVAAICILPSHTCLKFVINMSDRKNYLAVINLFSNWSSLCQMYREFQNKNTFSLAVRIRYLGCFIIRSILLR